MVYRVDLTPRAQQDVDRIYDSVIRDAPHQGRLWLDRFEQEILSLSSYPERCAAIPRLSTPNRIVRQLAFGQRRYAYLVYYVISGDIVNVLHIRRGARKEPTRL